MTFLPHGPSSLDYKTCCKVSEQPDSLYIIPEKAIDQTYPLFLVEKTIVLATIHLPWASALKDP